MLTAPIPLKRITLYKNDLGYFERIIAGSKIPSLIQVVKKNKKLVIDTLCTTANIVTFDMEDHDKYVAQNIAEHYFTFNDFSSSTSFVKFLQTCIGADLALSVQGSAKEQVGVLIMVDEKQVLLSPTSTETTEHYSLQILNRDGFIRRVDRKKTMNLSTINFLFFYFH